MSESKICEQCGSRFARALARSMAAFAAQRFCGAKCNSASRRKSFWEMVDKTGDCWLWLGATYQGGHGCFRGDGAHRIAYRELVGPIPSGMCVCHRCDVPLCVRPGHLFLGTKADNNADRSRKMRGGNYKLTVDSVRILKSRIAAGENRTALAREFGISHSSIYDIINGISWRNVS